MLQSVHYESSSVPSLPESALLAPGTTAQPPEPGVSFEGFEQQLGWCPGQWMMLVVPSLPPTEARHLHPAGTDAAEVRPPDCPFESALAAAGSGTF